MSAQLENGYTRIANEWIEVFSFSKFTQNEWQILWVIIRKTYGFQKKQDCIAYSQFEECTGLKKNVIIRCVQSLEKKGILIVTRNGYLNRYGLNKEYIAGGVTVQEQGVTQQEPQRVTVQEPKRVTQQEPTKERKKIKESIVANATSFIINNIEYNMEELEYVSEYPTKRKSKYGSKTMAMLVRAFAESADIDIGDRFDASPWSKPLSAIYNYFDKDADATIAFIKRASVYYEEKGLSYTPHTLHKNLPLIDKWIQEKQDKQFNPDLYE